MIQVIADEIHFEGELVAIVATSPSHSLMTRFLDHLDEAVVPEETAKAGDGADGKPTDYDQALDDVQRAAKEYAKGGLLRVADLATIITRLKEETS